MNVSLYFDENGSHHVAGDLRRRRYVETTAAEEGRSGAPDSHQLLFAAERGWTVVTHNGDDFRLLHDAWLLWSHRWGMPQEHSGILVVGPGAGHAPAVTAKIIEELLSDSATSLNTTLYDWKRSTGWVKFPG